MNARPLCRRCESAPGTLGDPHLGPVCADCYALLTIARAALEEVGPIAGIGVCSNEINHCSL
jgi:hypothetical protein